MHVALHLGYRVVDGQAVVEGLLAAPAHGVEARVHHEPARAEQLVVELAKMAGDVALVPAGLGGERLRGRAPQPSP